MPEHESNATRFGGKPLRAALRKRDALANRPASSADDLGPAGTDPVYGRGRVNARRAVQ